MKIQKEAEHIVLIQNIPYSENTDREKPEMDAWLPKRHGGAMPACLLLHGGGWTTGDKGDEREINMAKRLCGMGYAVFSANYHMALYEEGPYQGRRLQSAWPGCTEDCLEAVAFIRRNADRFFIDSEKIAVIGSSAGGHLALWLATEISSRISCAVALYSVPDILKWGGNLLMPMPYEESREEWKKASPAERLEERPSPILLIHGDRDETVDFRLSVDFYNKLREKEYEAEMIIVEGGRHSFDFSALSEKQFQTVARFLETHLGKEKNEHEEKCKSEL